MSFSHNADFAFTHRLNAFVRFEYFPPMVLFAQIKDEPTSSVVDSLKHFCHRYPTFIIAFYQPPTLWSASLRKDTSLPLQKEFESKEKAIHWLANELNGIKESFSASIEWNNEYYDVFFESQFIEQRKNTALQKRMMPAFFLDKNSPEYKSIKKHARTMSNTTLKCFEQNL